MRTKRDPTEFKSRSAIPGWRMQSAAKGGRPRYVHRFRWLHSMSSPSVVTRNTERGFNVNASKTLGETGGTGETERRGDGETGR